MTDLILPGLFGTVASADYTPYYLIKVTNNLVLKETRVDDYGSECTAGLRVIIGNYLLLYKELKKGKLFKKDDKCISAVCLQRKKCREAQCIS